MKKATISDVALYANVSKSTVSQYLNKRFHYMGEETKRKIEKAIDDLGYQANFIARSLKQGRTSTIGVIVANILHTFSIQVTRAIEDVCHDNDFHVIICNADDNPEKEKNYIKMLRAKQVDGLIVFPTGDNIDLYQQMVAENFPLIFLDRIVENMNVDTLLMDNDGAAKKAVDHFVEHGHRQIAMITTTLIRKVTPRVERINGFKKALFDHGIEPKEDYIKGIELKDIQKGFSQMMNLKSKPTAILAGNDLTLIEILKFAKKNGLAIPSDISLIGIDDVSFAEFFDPPLTTIIQPTFKMGTQAATLLLEKIRESGSDCTGNIYRFETQLIKRESVVRHG
jgi:LacI family transcriptional regulator, kdg operon repressor